MLDRFVSKIEEAELKTDPFDHVVIEDFVDLKDGKKLEEDFPKEGHDYWDKKKCGDTTFYKLSSSSADMYLPKSLRNVIYMLNGGAVCNAIREKFNIVESALFSDPTLGGGGLHAIGKNGFLKIHSDFNYHPSLKLKRRINLLFYLNYDWEESWGGNIDLWSTDMKERKVSVPPLGGKCVIFATNDDSYHGHPYPLDCPEDVMRKSIALYYYTVDPDCVQSIINKTRTTKYMRIPE